MNLHTLTRGSFRKNVVGVIVASIAVVSGVALIGRGVLNLEGALTVERPSVLTVTRLLEPYELIAANVVELPKRQDGEWRYSIRMNDGTYYFVRIAEDGPPWHLSARPEPLRGAPVTE